ncbi:ferric iron uptake transcriptional regulator [Granulosicoccus sp.]|nr:ferric iron uptake transcriptional regulator [Granulosicoccus sp.]MDC0434098.1 ferric iron uptake transcriptional regulator [bacterium]
MKQNHANVDLKKAGLKVTLPRVSILEILEEAEQHHMSAEDVYKTLLKNGNEIGLATVYRVLTQFEAAGLVTRHHFDGGQAIFELDNGDNHDHIVCLKTGRVAEFKDAVIEERLEQIAKDLGYTLNDHKIVLYGEVMDVSKVQPKLEIRTVGSKED